MAWVTFSIRKLTLKSRVNQLNARVMQISQQLQTQQRQGAYKLEMLQTNKNAVLENLDTQYNQQIQNLSNQAQNAKDKDKTNINNQITELQQAQSAEKEYWTSLFERQEKQLTEENQRKEAALEMQQEQIQTQAEAAKAEYDSVKEACSQHIKDDAPKFV
ncbi:hypothetical protein IKA92_04220 [bacterium]|nr:hypothetical protein [bacterium]